MYEIIHNIFMLETNTQLQAVEPDRFRSLKEAPAPSVDFDEKTQKVLGKAFWKMAELYEFTREEQAVLLGIRYNRQRLLQLEKEKSIPFDPDKFIRMGHLLGIHRSLQILYPHNMKIVYAWMKIRHWFFNDKSAMEFIMEDPVNSMARLFTVRRILDQMRMR